VSWHQDSTYFGLSPAEHVTAWVALSHSNLESGCVQVIPGSHHQGQLAHGVEKSLTNLFSTGQTVEVGRDAPLEFIILKPGEFSLHHTHLLHHSMGNRSDDRRIGLGVSYIPTRCVCSATQRLSASLVRGEDKFGHFDLDPRPQADHDTHALAIHAEAMRRWHAARAELIPRAHAASAEVA
jgi:ectoine hydroxylase-related dioxygenase (phytanoyl-CoA dioxygenase family)